MGATLAQYNDRKAVVQQSVFSVTNTKAAVRYSEPMQIVAMHYDTDTREIRVVGEDGNVRTCKIARMDLNHARELWTNLKEIKNSAREIQFMAAGGFSPDKWFYDVKG
jgi:site-specific recombinase XerC